MRVALTEALTYVIDGTKPYLSPVALGITSYLLPFSFFCISLCLRVFV